MRTLVHHVGDDAVRAIVVETVPGGWFETVADHRVMLGLGRAVLRDGQVGEGRRQLTEETIRRLREAAFRSGVDRSVVSLDPALAAAADADDLIAGVRRAAGVEVVVRCPDEQALGMVVAAARALGSPQLRPALELGDTQLRWSARTEDGAALGTVAVGIETLLAEHPDPLTPAGRAAAAATVAELLRSPGVAALLPAVLDGGPLVVGGAAAVTLAEAVLTRRWGGQRPHAEGTRLTADDLHELGTTLQATGPAGRLTLPEVDPAESDRVAVALLLLTELTGRISSDGLVVTTARGHDGDVLAALGLLGGDAPLDAVAAVLPSELAGCDAFALRLFAALRDQLGLGDLDRELLARALTLPGAASLSAHRRQARELLDNGVRGLEPDRLVELACLVRFRRGRLPGAHFSPYTRLPRIRRRAVDRLTGILRLAIALDTVVDAGDCTVTVAPDRTVVTIPSDRSVSSGISWLSGIERLLGTAIVVRDAPTAHPSDVVGTG